MMSRAEMLAVIAIINRDLPGLLPKGLEEVAVTAEAGDVLTALIRLLPPELRASIEREAAEDAAPLTRH
jgi:hypothetical protein